MSSALKEFRAAMRSPVPYVSWVLLTGIVAVSGPFDTYMRFPLSERLAYWAVVFAVCIAWGIFARVFVQVHFPRTNYWIASLIVASVSVALLVWPIHAFTLFMAGDGARRLPGTAEIAGLIFVIAVGMAALRWALTQDRRLLEVAQVAEGEDAGAGERPAPRLLSRLDPCLRGEILRISGRDHFVDVVTDKGAASLRLRLSDALAEIEEVEGLQVHRSHWVSAAAIAGALREKGRYFLLTVDGGKVPVSRANESRLAERGLIRTPDEA